MSTELKVGQVLWLKVRYQIDKISDIKHPMLIAEVNDEYIEIIALDKTADLLSKDKLTELLDDYREYQSNNKIREERIVHMTKYEVLELNEI